MKVDIIGVPIFYGADRYGVEKGPDTLRRAGVINLLREQHEVNDLGNVYISDISDTNKFDTNNKAKYLDAIVEANSNLAVIVNRSIRENHFPLIIGGDHSIAIGSIAGISSGCKEDLAVIWIDAHGDLNTVDTTESGNIHGMPLAASIGEGLSELKNILYKGIKVKRENIFLVGVRDLDKGEIDFIRNNNINIWSALDVREKGIANIVEQINASLREREINKVHVSFDIDSIDPQYMPGTGTAVENGITVDEARCLLGYIFESNSVVSLDFVEFNPDLDINNRTLKNCMTLIHSISNFLR